MQVNYKVAQSSELFITMCLGYKDVSGVLPQKLKIANSRKKTFALEIYLSESN
jgi:hypothetical protein